MIKLSAASLTDTGLQREENEDFLFAQVHAPLLQDPVGLFIVCDGMGGHMGGDQVTVKNLRVAKVDAENNLLYVRGAVPGGRNGLVFVRFSKNGKRGE